MPSWSCEKSCKAVEARFSSSRAEGVSVACGPLLGGLPLGNQAGEHVQVRAGHDFPVEARGLHLSLSAESLSQRRVSDGDADGGRKRFRRLWFDKPAGFLVMDDACNTGNAGGDQRPPRSKALQDHQRKGLPFA